MAGPNMDHFDAYFRRADLDRDGRINGAEAVAFFQGFNLPNQVLAQIWTYADQNRTGFLGRAEFYNALKLVTVAQSKQELTPDIVKGALYGPDSAKIPAPQINLAVTLAPQSTLKAGTPIPQFSGAAPSVPQSSGVRGPQGFPYQQGQFMRPPRPPTPSTAFHSQPGVASQGMPGGGIMAAPRPPSSSISTDWRVGRMGGPPAGVTSQLPSRGNNPSGARDGLGLVASGLTPSTQPRPQATTGLTHPAASRPNFPAQPSYGVGAKDSKAFPVSGNGVASDSVFGDVFSLTSSQQKQDSPVPTSSASGLPVSSATVPSSAGPQPTVKLSSLGSFQSPRAQQAVGGRHQQVQSAMKQNQQIAAQSSASFTSTAFSIGAGNSASGQSQLPWPRMTRSDVQKYSKVFVEVDTDRDGKITGEQARNLFLSWRLPREVLKQVWDLSDQDNDSMLSLREFFIALYLMERFREGRPPPAVLPSSIMFDETLLPSSSQPAAAYGSAVWRPGPGLQQPRGMPSARPVGPAGLRPPGPVPIPQADEATQPSRQKLRVPVLEKHLVEQLSTEEQDSLNSKFQEATEADKKVEELEKEILDSREKIEFYRAKMQELILYKSRCDNRLNEVTERDSADKREVESLAKKYEEKYRQAGDVASKLTIEEATFRDIQEKKMELYKAIVKMEQDGKGDDVQVRADHIQLDLEELVKGLNERCRTYGLRAKPTSLVELPFGWQLGVQEGAADWNEEWDKFDDQGFAIVKELTLDVQNVIAPPKLKTSLVPTKAASLDEVVTTVSTSDADGESEKLPRAEVKIPEDELTNTEGDEGISRSQLESPAIARSLPESPARSNAPESPSKHFQDSQPRKNISGDGSPHATETQSEYGGAESVLSGDKVFDEPGWGTFDTHYDTDAAWDLNPVTTKDTDHERQSESSFFGSDDWGLNPIRTAATHTDNEMKKSTFTFDSVPSTPIYNSGSSPHGDYLFQKNSPFAFADSVPSTPMFSSGNSPRRFSEGPEEHSFDSSSRFDSVSMNASGFIPPSESTLARFDSMRSTRDSDYDQGLFPPHESYLTRFDSMRSTADSDYSHGFFAPRENTFTRFDSMRSTRDSEYNYGFPSFDDSDPFGSSEPFKSTDPFGSSESFKSTDPFGSSDPFKSTLESRTPF